MPEVTVHGLTKTFGAQTALDDVSFTVGDGAFFTLLGPSGCGKSTTLASIAGLERPDAGRISAGDVVYLDSNKGVYLTPEERNLGMVFQSYALWPHMTVAGNLELPLKLRRVPRPERNRLIGQTLEQVGLGPYRDRYPHQLSGGQQQRVALARALVYSPSVLLLDEPLSNLDAKLREQARGWLKQLQQEIGITTIYVTHDQSEALTLSDQIAVMRDGRMLQVGSPEEIYERPSSAAVADFVGRCNFLAGTVLVAPAAITAADDRHRLTVRVDNTRTELTVITDDQYAAGSRVTLGVRAERLAVHERSSADDESGGLPATVIQRLYSGSVHEYQLSCGEQTLVAEDASQAVGPDVWLQVPPDAIYVFGGEATAEQLHRAATTAQPQTTAALLDKVEAAAR